MDAETQDLLRGSVRDLLASGDDDIAVGLRDLGWADVVTEDPAIAIDLLFSEQGASGKASSALDTVAFATGEDGTGHPVLHPLGASTAGRMSDDVLDIDGVLLTEPHAAVVVAVGSADAGVSATYLLDADPVAAASTPVRGFAPGSRLHRLRLKVDRPSLTPVAVDWAAVDAAARRALAAELVGNGNAMLGLAAVQIADRHQFGRPIGANQSPRHRLAEAYAWLCGASELVRMAWQSGTAWDARVAKAYAGYAVEATGRACLQVCGAIGLTTEHELPTYVQRARILDALYGGWSDAATDIGAQLLTTAAVPAGARL